MSGGGWHGSTVFKLKNCVVCNKSFQPHSGVHKCCSESCKGKQKYIIGTVTTESQYKLISGNWKAYLRRLVHKERRDALAVEDLLEIIEKQNYKCALSGESLTCILEKGKISKTNASIDRIQAGGPYSKDNIQLVCRALNSWRGDTDLNEFISWCEKVANYSKKKE